MLDPLIEIHGLRKVYRTDGGDIVAAENIYLTIDKGEFVAIMGPSGSGKSTLMGLIGLLERPTSGIYYLEGLDTARLGIDELAEQRRRKIGFVFQTYNLLPRCTAIENVELPLVYAGVDTTKSRNKAVQALEGVGLKHRVNHWPRQLSGGEQQRVALARALVNEPLLILADEPTGALDSQTGLGMLALLQALNRRGQTIILVTHDQAVSSHAKRVIRMKDGCILSDERVSKPKDAIKQFASLVVSRRSA